jgi:hypothetical protein
MIYPSHFSREVLLEVKLGTVPVVPLKFESPIHIHVFPKHENHTDSYIRSMENIHIHILLNYC